MTRPLALIALPLLIGAATPASAALPVAERAALNGYLRARAADAAGQAAVAAQGYAAALAQAPGDAVLATRTYRQAMTAGDRALALAAARQLDAAGVAPPDARLLFVTDAVLARDWNRARAQVEAVKRDGAFGFLAPILLAWVDLGSGSEDPLAPLATVAPGAIATAYVTEHRALLLLAMRRHEEGAAAIRALALPAGGRTVRLRIAAAATLARGGKRDVAMAMLDGADPVLASARARLAARKRLPGPILTPADGLAELFARVAIDINHERVTPLALALARLSTFLAPDSAETWLVTGELLAASDHPDAALAALAQVTPDDPFAEAARGARLQLLVRKGAQTQALAEAEAVATRDGAVAADWVRVGDIRSELDQHRAAADAFTRALALAEADPTQKDAIWTFLLLQGGALEQAKDWAAAKPVLERAAALAPDEAMVLNYLGYAQLERRENLAQAEALIERASRLKPDDPSIADSLGWAYYVRGKLAPAIVALERAVAGDPGEPTINEHLGDAYWAAGRRVDARYAWTAALVGAEAPATARLRAKIDSGLTVALAAP